MASVKLRKTVPDTSTEATESTFCSPVANTMPGIVTAVVNVKGGSGARRHCSTTTEPLSLVKKPGHLVTPPK